MRWGPGENMTFERAVSRWSWRNTNFLKF